MYDVIDGNADVGFVRTDMVERMDAAGTLQEEKASSLAYRTHTFLPIRSKLPSAYRPPTGEANISDVRFLFSREDAAALEFPFPVATGE